MRSDPERKLVMLVQANDKCPVEEWIRGLRDKVTRLKIERQIDKLARGLGLQKSLGSVSELKIDLGPGYRVYYALLDQKRWSFCLAEATNRIKVGILLRPNSFGRILRTAATLKPPCVPGERTRRRNRKNLCRKER